MRTARAALLAFAVLLPSAARAAFEDAGFGPRDVGMGGAFCAVVDDAGAVAYNPAALGQATDLEPAVSYLRHFHIPSGPSDRDSTRAALVVPVRQDLFNGAFGFDARYDRRLGVGADRAFGALYGTRGWRESGGTGLDFGGGFKVLSTSYESGGKSGSHLALDLGALWRLSERHALGASLLNFGRPKFKGDRAPLALKLGAAEQIRNVTLAVDVTKREPSAGLRGQHTLALGFERWWATPRLGQYALRSGMSLGDRSRTWSWGLGWRGQGARLDYAMIVPMTGVTRVGHGLSLTIRFGRADPEGEYERLLSEELRYRRRLGEELEAGSLKQSKLSDEIARLRAETAALRTRLESSNASESDAKRRLKELEARQRAAAERFEALKAEREGVARKTKAALFAEDWRDYQKAKLAGAPDPALLERVTRLLREHKDSGVDLGEASQELRRLQLAR